MHKLKTVFEKVAALFRYRLYSAWLTPDIHYIVLAGSKEEAFAKLYAKMQADPKYQALIAADELPPQLEYQAALSKALAHARRTRFENFTRSSRFGRRLP